MAYSTPKENWTALDIPVASDFNRIEGNAHANHDDIAAEATARGAADTTLTNSVAAINADLAGLDFANGVAGTVSYHSFSPGDVWLLPAGIYMIAGAGDDSSGTPRPILEIQKSTPGTWVGWAAVSGLILVDGINFRIINKTFDTFDMYYRKLA